MKYITRSK